MPVKNTNYHERLLGNYSGLIDRFLNEIAFIDTKNLPEPHLPVIGANYGKKHPKVLFWGWETRNAQSLPKWIKKVKQSRANAFTWFEEEFEAFEFVYWRSNFNQDFWSFNLRILARLHGLPDWKVLYKDPDSYEEILSSFAWANTDSIERFEVTAQSLGACQESWSKLKQASRSFDSANLVIKSLEPDIIVLVNWDAPEDWLLNELTIVHESIPDEFIWYYEISNPETHLFWTPHPRGFNSRELSIDDISDSIVKIYRDRTS